MKQLLALQQYPLHDKEPSTFNSFIIGLPDAFPSSGFLAILFNLIGIHLLYIILFCNDNTALLFYLNENQ